MMLFKARLCDGGRCPYSAQVIQAAALKTHLLPLPIIIIIITLILEEEEIGQACEHLFVLGFKELKYFLLNWRSVNKIIINSIEVSK